MTFRILCVGRVRESFFQGALGEYEKRLSRYAKVEILECPDEKAPERLSEAEAMNVKRKEGGRILDRIRDGDYVIALSIGGKRFTSEAFAGHIKDLMVSGRSTVSFVIGGSLGLSPEVIKRADEEISFSDFTFPHQLMRVILLEQIYRAEKILSGEPYHK